MDRPQMNKKIVFTTLLALGLAGCASQPFDKSGDLPFLFEDALKPQLTGSEALQEKQDQFPEPSLFPGSDRMVNLPPAEKPFTLEGEAVTLGFEQAPLTEVVHAILGDLLKMDYSIDRPLSGEITLHTRAKVEISQLFPILESVLQANGANIVQGPDGLYHVGPGDAVRGLSSKLNRAGSQISGFGLDIIPLQYIGAGEMADILGPVAPPEAFVRVDGRRNLLILAGSRSQLEGWTEIIRMFDIDLLKGMSVGIFPLEYTTVGDISQILNSLLGKDEGTGAPPAAPISNAKGKDKDKDNKNVEIAIPREIGSGLIRVLPVERLNSILVITPRAHYLTQIEEWLKRLDRAPDSAFEPQIFIYPIQNSSAQQLAKLISGLFSGESSVSSGTTGSSVAPGLSQSRLSSSIGSSSTSKISGSSSSMGSMDLDSGSSQGGTRSTGSTQLELGDQVRVVADGESNTLIIYAPRREYVKIEKALRQLDKAPNQVLIEVSILEVTLNDDLQYGLNWMFENAGIGNKSGIASLNLNSSGPIAPAQPGFSYTISSAGQIRAVLNALASKSLVKVLSSPSVLVLDNQTAAIHVGDQQPILAGETITSGGNISSNIQFKDTGVMLSVTPSINTGGMVTMNIQQTVTDVGSVDTATRQRSFMQRNITTRVAVRSGDSITLGGLIKENESKGKQGIPVLHTIPVIGNLFGSTANSTVRTELLVMITPRVLENDDDLRTISREYRERLQGLKMIQRDLEKARENRQRREEEEGTL